MRRFLMMLIAAAVVASAAPVAAQTPEEAAVTLVDQGYYIGPFVSIDEDRLSDLVSDAANTGALVMIVVLDSDPAGGATSFATGVLSRLGAGTVLVITETGSVGYDTVEFERSRVEGALDRADEVGGTDIEYLTAVVSELTGVPGVTPTPVATTAVAQAAETSSGGGGGSGLLILLFIVVGGGLLIWFVMRRSRKAAMGKVEGQIASARREIQAQLDTMANDILDMSDRVSVRGDDTAQAYFEAGSQTYAKATEQLEDAQDISQLEGISDRLDEAAWQLDAAEAVLAGKAVPPKPAKESARCFFDPTHRGPMEEAVLKTSAGDREVRVCSSDAEELRRGERPRSRKIDVGGRKVEASRAPRSHGGGGFGGMDLLSILVGGMASGLPTGGRKSGGGLGGLFKRRSGGGRVSRASRPQQQRGSGPQLPSPSRRGRRTTSSQPPPSAPKPKRARGGRKRRR